ncbi:hypothetical protein LTR15_008655 [Elasticomyces elasticus]|nr:hypothetical protein LTR15_008655 [Elasticomyces elasticus]
MFQMPGRDRITKISRCREMPADGVPIIVAKRPTFWFLQMRWYVSRSRPMDIHNRGRDDDSSTNLVVGTGVASLVAMTDWKSDSVPWDDPSIDGKGWSNPPSVALNPNTQATPVDREALKLHQFSENKIPQRDVSSTTSTSVVTPPVSTSPASSVPSSHSLARSSAIATAPTGKDWYPWAALHTVAPPACGKSGKKFKATG